MQRLPLAFAACLAAHCLIAGVDAHADWPPGPLRVSDRCEVFGFRALPDDSGGAIVAAVDRQARVALFRIRPDGTRPSTWPDCGVPIAPGPPELSDPILVADPAGGAYVIWKRRISDAIAQRRVQRVGFDGVMAPGWPDSGLSVGVPGIEQGTAGIGTNDGDETVACADDAGGVIVVWVTPDLAGGHHVRAQRISGSGRRVWAAAGVVVCGRSGEQRVPAVVADGLGGAFVAWQDDRDAELGSCIVAQHLDDRGRTTYGDEGRRVSSPEFRDARFPSLVPLSQGAIAVWQASEARHYVVLAQRMDPHVSRRWNDDAIVRRNTGGLVFPMPNATASDGDGAIVVWLDTRDRVSTVTGQRLTASGRVAPGWPEQGMTVAAALPYPEIRDALVLTPDGTGGAFVAWTDFFNDPAIDDLRSLARATHVTSRGGIASGWPDIGRTMSDPDLQVWGRALNLVGDGAGGAIVSWADASLHGLTQSWVEKVASEPRLVRDAAPASERPVATPGAAFAIRSISPMPMRGDGRIVFDASRQAHVTYAIFDVAGRAAAHGDCGVLGPGRHVLELPARSLRAGAYVVRLAQDRETRSQRIVVAP